MHALKVPIPTNALNPNVIHTISRGVTPHTQTSSTLPMRSPMFPLRMNSRSSDSTVERSGSCVQNSTSPPRSRCGLGSVGEIRTGCVVVCHLDGRSAVVPQGIISPQGIPTSYCPLFIRVPHLSLGFTLTISQVTAVMYFKRFFLRQSFLNFDAVRLMLTCIYVAGKVRDGW